jgi:tetratricopeptide (TPR) repeat protein
MINLMEDRRMKKIGLKSCAFLLCLVFAVGGCASRGYNKYTNEFYDQGLAWFGQAEYDRAIESFTKVLEMAPYGGENYKVYYNRGMAYLKNRDYEKAIYDFTKTIEMTPQKDKEIVYYSFKSRGDAWQAKKEYPNAIKDYGEALQLFPQHAGVKNVYEGRAWAALNMEKYDDAIADFTAALSIDGRLANSYYGRGLAWYKKGDPQRAMQDAKEAVKLKSDSKDYDDLVFEIRSSMKNK